MTSDQRAETDMRPQDEHVELSGFDSDFNGILDRIVNPTRLIAHIEPQWLFRARSTRRTGRAPSPLTLPSQNKVHRAVVAANGVRGDDADQ